MVLINLVCTRQAILYLVCLFLHFLGLLILNPTQFLPGDPCMDPLELFQRLLNLVIETLGLLLQILVALLVGTLLLINRTLSKLWEVRGQLITMLAWRIRAVSLLVEGQCPNLD
jgi:hypothetical protein